MFFFLFCSIELSFDSLLNRIDGPTHDVFRDSLALTQYKSDWLSHQRAFRPSEILYSADCDCWNTLQTNRIYDPC